MGPPDLDDLSKSSSRIAIPLLEKIALNLSLSLLFFIPDVSKTKRNILDFFAGLKREAFLVVFTISLGGKTDRLPILTQVCLPETTNLPVSL